MDTGTPKVIKGNEYLSEVKGGGHELQCGLVSLVARCQLLVLWTPTYVIDYELKFQQKVLLPPPPPTPSHPTFIPTFKNTLFYF